MAMDAFNLYVSSINLQCRHDTRSITVLSTSRKFAKVICNTSSPQSGMVKRGELCHISEVPTALQVATSGQPSIIKVGFMSCMQAAWHMQAWTSFACESLLKWSLSNV
jgi:hypothetical protein